MGACADVELSDECSISEVVSDCRQCRPEERCLPSGVRGYVCLSSFEVDGGGASDAAVSEREKEHVPAVGRPPHGHHRPGHRDAREPIEDFFDG